MRRQFLAVLGVFGIAGGMVAVQSASAETAVDCVATAATGGPWSNVYNQSVTVRDLLGGSGVFNGARVTVTLPAGHSYAGGWNPTLAPSSDRTVVLDIDGSLPAGGTLTNSGFNVTVASDADLSLRPTFSCEALPATPVPTTTVNPPTTSTPEPTTTVPAAACGVSAVTGGPWGNTYNQSLTIRSLFGGAGSSINGVAVTVRFPAGHSYSAGWNPSIPESAASTIVLNVDGLLSADRALSSTGFNVAVAADADLALRPSYSCAPRPGLSVPTTAPSISTTTLPGSGPVCIASAATGGPWSNVYNQSITIRDLRGGSGFFNGARVSATLPAGHLYAEGWNATLISALGRSVVLDINGQLPADGSLTAGGFNVTVAADADPSMRPTFTCEALPVTVPPTTISPPTTIVPTPPTTIPPTTTIVPPATTTVPPATTTVPPTTTTTTLPPPGVPAIFVEAIDADLDFSTDHARISWTPPTGTVTRYNVQRDALPSVDAGAATLYVDPVVPPTAAMAWRVQACNGASCGAWSEYTSLSTCQMPPAPSVAVTSATNATVTVTDCAIFRLKITVSPAGPITTTGPAVSGVWTQYWTGLTPGTDYSFTVQYCSLSRCYFTSEPTHVVTSEQNNLS